MYKNLLLTPHKLTGDDYEVQARIQLGFQAVQIFGTGNITASLKQIVTYVTYYVEKALSDSDIIGLPITLITLMTVSWRQHINKIKRIPCYFLEDEMVSFQSTSIKNKSSSSNLQMKCLS